MYRFDHLEELLLVEYSRFAGFETFVVFGTGERMSTAFVPASISLEKGMADIGLR